MTLTGFVMMSLSGCLQATPPAVITHRGMANASAVVAVDGDRFLAASDEDNTLRLYHTRADAEPDAAFDAGPWLRLRGR